MRAYFNAVYQRFAEVSWGNVRPGFATITGKVNKAAIAARPDLALLKRACRQVGDSVVNFAAGAYIGVRRTAIALLRSIVAGKVGADGGPVDSPVVGAQHFVGSMVYNAGFKGIGNDWRIPVEPQWLQAGSNA